MTAADLEALQHITYARRFAALTTALAEAEAELRKAVGARDALQQQTARLSEEARAVTVDATAQAGALAALGVDASRASWLAELRGLHASLGAQLRRYADELDANKCSLTARANDLRERLASLERERMGAEAQAQARGESVAAIAAELAARLAAVEAAAPGGPAATALASEIVDWHTNGLELEALAGGASFESIPVTPQRAAVAARQSSNAKGPLVLELTAIEERKLERALKRAELYVCRVRAMHAARSALEGL